MLYACCCCCLSSILYFKCTLHSFVCRPGAFGVVQEPNNKKTKMKENQQKTIKNKNRYTQTNAEIWTNCMYPFILFWYKNSRCIHFFFLPIIEQIFKVRRWRWRWTLLDACERPGYAFFFISFFGWSVGRPVGVSVEVERNVRVPGLGRTSGQAGKWHVTMSVVYENYFIFLSSAFIFSFIPFCHIRIHFLNRFLFRFCTCPHDDGVLRKVYIYPWTCVSVCCVWYVRCACNVLLFIISILLNNLHDSMFCNFPTSFLTFWSSERIDNTN